MHQPFQKKCGRRLSVDASLGNLTRDLYPVYTPGCRLRSEMENQDVTAWIELPSRALIK